MRPFGKAEYLQRLHKTRLRMSDAGIEILLVTDPANMNWLSGYDGWSFYVHQLLLVVIDQEEPIWIGRAQDAAGARLTSFLDYVNIIGYPDDYVQSTERHPMDFVADLLRGRGWHGRPLGVEMDSYYFTAQCYHSLVAGLPETPVVNANLLVNWARAVKSPQEIAYMRQAAQIAARAMETAVETIRPGVRQCDVVGEIYKAQVTGTPDFGGDYTAIVPLMPTGESSAAPHITWSDDSFVDGAGTIVELAGCRHRYHCPMARTVYLGTPPANVRDTASVVIEGLETALEAARPGATAEQVELAWRQVIERHGIIKESRIGYSTGLNYPPDWGEHTISLRPGDTTVLEPGMTLHMIPGLWLEDWGIEISACFLVTETGSEALSDFPRELFIKT